ncbi:MAG: hypothetical protein Q8O87_00455 [bacterium]|nr:hypothetical protein [bacterium]
MKEVVLELRQQQVLYDKKWLKLLKRTWVFRHLPFVEFVLAAGSLATGNVNSNSDFDVIINARYGRIFTARAFAVLLLGLLGWRRRKLSHKEAAADKICLNHFVTDKSLGLAPPYNAYWKNLYKNLIPVYGDQKSVQIFWDANEPWLGEAVLYKNDLRHKYTGSSSLVKRALESLLRGSLGNGFENILKTIQINKIEMGLKLDTPGYMPRIIYSDAELEFHPDTYRTTLLQK